MEDQVFCLLLNLLLAFSNYCLHGLNHDLCYGIIYNWCGILTNSGLKIAISCTWQWPRWILLHSASKLDRFIPDYSLNLLLFYFRKLQILFAHLRCKCSPSFSPVLQASFSQFLKHLESSLWNTIIRKMTPFAGSVEYIGV